MNRTSRINGINKIKNERIEQITYLKRIIPNSETLTNSSCFFFKLYKTEGHYFIYFYIKQ